MPLIKPHMTLIDQDIHTSKIAGFMIKSILALLAAVHDTGISTWLTFVVHVLRECYDSCSV